MTHRTYYPFIGTFNVVHIVHLMSADQVVVTINGHSLNSLVFVMLQTVGKI